MEAMIDIETWGKEPGCQIRSIGAVLFDPYDWSKPMPEFYRNIDVAGQEQLGLVRDPETVDWWSKQSWDAQSVFSTPHPVMLHTALGDLFQFTREAEFFWSHGNFDFPIIDEACNRCWLTSPWKSRKYGYALKMDTRPVYRFAKIKPICRPGYMTKHHALHDAYNQAYAVQTAVSALCVEPPPGVIPNFLRK